MAKSSQLADNHIVDPRRLDDHLHEWISVANQRSVRYGFPAGLVERRVQVLRACLGDNFLADLFASKQPVHLLGLRGQVLQQWLRGGSYVNSHVIEIMTSEGQTGRTLKK